jgi:hypothetical protein
MRLSNSAWTGGSELRQVVLRGLLLAMTLLVVKMAETAI